MENVEPKISYKLFILALLAASRQFVFFGNLDWALSTCQRFSYYILCKEDNNC